MATLLRRLYRGSDRPHHLKLNTHLACALLGVTGAFVWAGAPWVVLAAPFGCWMQEEWASPDRDEQEKRIAKGYWEPYGRAVKHRAKWSHSLVMGTPIRILYGYWFGLPLALLYPGWAVAFVVGCVVSDMGHYALDLNQHWGIREAVFGRK